MKTAFAMAPSNEQQPCLASTIRDCRHVHPSSFRKYSRRRPARLRGGTGVGGWAVRPASGHMFLRPASSIPPAPALTCGQFQQRDGAKVAEIILVRHGQANSHATDEASYDQLSELGG